MAKQPLPKPMKKTPQNPNGGQSAKKPAAKSNSALASPMVDRQYASVSVRKIDNGFIISESHEGPKGYSHKERFSPTKPTITMPLADAPKAKK